MELFYRDLGAGKPLIILHGLYGSSDNWLSIAKVFATKYRVILPDLRNHGNSPHYDEFSIKSLKEDLIEIIEKLKIDKFYLIGHSLGGKTAMEYASYFSENILKLIIVDIAPKVYTKEEFEEYGNHKQIISILKSVDLSKYKTRNEALEKLCTIDKTGRLRNFMMKNLARTTTGELKWKINLKAISDNLSSLLNEFNTDLSKINCETLFIKGGKSSYLLNADFENIKKQIRNVNFLTIKGATHWVHADKPEEFVNTVLTFFES